MAQYNYKPPATPQLNSAFNPSATQGVQDELTQSQAQGGPNMTELIKIMMQQRNKNKQNPFLTLQQKYGVKS